MNDGPIVGVLMIYNDYGVLTDWTVGILGKRTDVDM